MAYDRVVVYDDTNEIFYTCPHWDVHVFPHSIHCMNCRQMDALPESWGMPPLSFAFRF